MDFEHIPVMLNEVLDGLNIKENGIYIDGTLGGAGHSTEIVKKLTTGMLIGIDQDENAIKKSKKVLADYSDRVIFVHDNFRNIDKILNRLEIKKVDGILLDLGVSSHQFDEGERGFSYRKDASLDMRMDRSNSFSAWDVVNKYNEKQLEEVLWNFGQEKWAKRIAKFIVEERKEASIDTTYELVTIIKKAIPKKVRSKGGHPGRKTFQAIRIEVNKELDILKESILNGNKVLNKKGRLCIITFHSLEDRIVKRTFKYLNKDCICPPEFPICTCDKTKDLNILTRKPATPGKEEIGTNPRSRSAKLRIAEKV